MRQLPRGVRLDHGYVQVRLFHNGRAYFKNFGRDCDLARELAANHVGEKRNEFLRSKVGIEPDLPRRRFEDVARLWLDLWGKEKAPDGAAVRSHKSILNTRSIYEKSIAPFFARRWYDEIRPKDVVQWRNVRLASVLGTSVNREQAVLSSIFSHVADWVKTERVRSFKLPEEENPTSRIDMAKTRVRHRIITDYELKKIKLAFTTLNDLEGWEICKLALNTVLSLNDLKALQVGEEIDIARSKSGVQVRMPVPVLQKLNWVNFRKRWEAAREMAGIADCQFRDLRKTGINQLIGQHDIKLVSQFAAHSSLKTTENSYTVVQRELLRPLASKLGNWVEGL